MRKISRSATFLISLIFLIVVFLLSMLRPPVAFTPHLDIERSGQFELRVILADRLSLRECKQVLSRLERQNQQICPDCGFPDRGCIVSPGPLVRAVQSDEPLENYSLRFLGGDVVLLSAASEFARSWCDESERAGIGRCFKPGEVRPKAAATGFNFFAEKKFQFFSMSTWTLLFSAFIGACLLSLAILATKRWHERHTADHLPGIQRFHVGKVPRIGGLSIFLTLFLAAWLGSDTYSEFRVNLLWPLVIASVPAFAFGLAEDITKSVGVSSRLMATMASAIVAWWLTGVSIHSVDVPLLDGALQITVVSLVFTAIAVGGIANAINIIDGFHGLASGVSIIILSAMATIAIVVGDIPLALLCAIVAASILGFFVVNFPGGKLFLGDGGAYLIGFWIGWLGVMLAMRNPQVSPWAVLLLCAYPVVETLFSIYRRLKSRLHIGHPDREHLHSLFKVAVIDQMSSKHLSSNGRNAMVSPFFWCLAAIPAVLATVEPANLELSSLIFLGFVLLYWLVYRVLRKRLQA